MSEVRNDFYEEDESAETIDALFLAGSKRVTERPHTPWVVVQPVLTVGVGMQVLPQRSVSVAASVSTNGAPIPA